ncbi:MAG: GDP-mannose 4,6-dehydratase [Thaumarchaeota archaeon]|nr:GDP-mannose 4,6-dehydratase [Nitrososphaerota archaeon]
MKNILVTGGAGFIGSHLVDQLIALGHKVAIVDNLSTGRESNLIQAKNKVKLVNIDLASSYENVRKHLASSIPDVIYHLACHPRQNSFADPWRDLDVNQKSTISILELAKQNKAKVIYSSNSGIYGIGEGRLPIDEGFPDDPATPYDVHKLASENEIRVYSKTFGVPCTIFRFATVYGPRQRSTSNWKPVIAEFTEKLLRNEASEIWGDGESTRDFIYVSDIVDALITAMSTRTDSRPIILSTNTETSVNHLYNTLSKILKTEIKPRRSEAKPGEIRRMLLDNNRAKKMLGWQPKVTLEEGLKSVVDWMKTQSS